MTKINIPTKNEIKGWINEEIKNSDNRMYQEQEQLRKMMRMLKEEVEINSHQCAMILANENIKKIKREMKR